MINNYELQVRCIGLENNDIFPLENTGRGKDISPAFEFENLSPMAKTIAITLEDIKHPLFKNFTHWVIWNIPASKNIIGAIPHGKNVGILNNAIQGIAYGWHKYAGPKPPKGKQHQYRFTIYVLDNILSLSPNSTKRKFIKAARNHILQQATVIGRFE
ncbi:YbhB/YbcL family Raf kinase inhibitor-like protein [Anaerotruncus colihominis]|uniref:YbhB/YbcL family Raf kinase inhibitor-like protein n=1 Tax=Anaerotruncus colihominis TaxID=169435 RepID=UPI000F5C5630|nr:YbhB/YbcL family Raf kinase inhibitor-like protein [Clostridiales bacterium COT073_COT-073]